MLEHCQLVVNGTASQAEISRAFQVPLKTVKRYVKRLREGSAKSFFETPHRRSASVQKGETKEQAQALLDEGKSVPEVGRKLGVLPNTLHKAIRAERLRQPQKKSAALAGAGEAAATNKSERGEIDSAAVMGNATTRLAEWQLRLKDAATAVADFSCRYNFDHARVKSPL